MENLICKNKKIYALVTMVILCIGMIVNKYVIAASNDVIIHSPTKTEESGTINFSVTFGSNVSNIWLSDGDIIKKGFTGNTVVIKMPDNSYNVVISNVSGVGEGKYIVINSGVGYVNGKPTEAVSSNVFSINQRKQEEKTNNDNTTKDNNNNNNNTNNTNNNNNNTNNNSNNNNNNNNNTNNNSNNNSNNSSINNNNNVNRTNNNTNISKNTSTINNNVTDVSKIDTSKTTKESNKEENKEPEKVKRPIPNTGKI